MLNIEFSIAILTIHRMASVGLSNDKITVPFVVGFIFFYLVKF